MAQGLFATYLPHGADYAQAVLHSRSVLRVGPCAVELTYRYLAERWDMGVVHRERRDGDHARIQQSPLGPPASVGSAERAVR